MEGAPPELLELLRLLDEAADALSRPEGSDWRPAPDDYPATASERRLADSFVKPEATVADALLGDRGVALAMASRRAYERGAMGWPQRRARQAARLRAARLEPRVSAWFASVAARGREDS